MSEQVISLAKCKQEGEHIRAKLLLAKEYLLQCGVEEAEENAQLLLLEVLQMDRAKLLMNWFEPFPQHKLDQWCEWLERKGNGEPLQYILGEAWFYGRKFAVTEDVLIPRPETELLVEAVLEVGRRLWPNSEEQPTVLDVGTGSGAIAVTLQLEEPRWQVVATDLSEQALQVAQRNAVTLDASVSAGMKWLQGDLLEPLIAERDNMLAYEQRPIQILVSNPPYIPQSDMADLQREVRDFEPHLALVGGVDGLDPYRKMIMQLSTLVYKPRIVAFELGIHQPAIVAEMLKELGAWDEVNIIKDYNGIERHVIAIKNSENE